MYPFVSEPLCTVLLKQMSDPIDVSREQLPAKPDGVTYPLATGPTQTQTVFPGNNRLGSDGRHIVRSAQTKDQSCLLRTRSGGLE